MKGAVNGLAQVVVAIDLAIAVFLPLTLSPMKKTLMAPNAGANNAIPKW